jgi:protein SCO1
MRNLLASLVVLIVGMLTLWWGTDEFRAFTAESARRIDITENAKPLPNVMLQDHNGEEFSLGDLKGKLVLATFIYTSCGDVCPILEMEFQEVYEQIPREYLGKDVVFLSFSFDFERDTVHHLNHYAQHFNTDGKSWLFTRFKNKKEMETVLKELGVVVIPNEVGGFEHNAAIYSIDENGICNKIFDYTSPDMVSNEMIEILENS